jgi:hypothetical protein
MQMTQEHAEKTGGRKPGVERIEETSEKELREQFEKIEKRVQRLEHHSFIQHEDVT